MGKGLVGERAKRERHNQVYIMEIGDICIGNSTGRSVICPENFTTNHSFSVLHLKCTGTLYKAKWHTPYLDDYDV